MEVYVLFSAALVIVVEAVRAASGSCEKRLVPPSTTLLEPEVHVKSVDKGGSARMACRFCDEGPSLTGRQWFRRSLEGDFSRLIPDAHDDPSLNRRSVGADHALTLVNVSEADVGFYVCHDNEEPPAQYRMEYLLDVAVPRQTESRTVSVAPELEDESNNKRKEARKVMSSSTRSTWKSCRLPTKRWTWRVPCNGTACPPTGTTGSPATAAAMWDCAGATVGASCGRASTPCSCHLGLTVAGPGVSVTWFYNGSKLRPTWSRVSLQGASREVLFKPLKERDAGVYECTVQGVKMGHLELQVKAARERRALGMSDASWVTVITILVNFCAYLAVVSINWQQHYKRLEIQDYLASKRAEKGQQSP